MSATCRAQSWIVSTSIDRSYFLLMSNSSPKDDSVERMIGKVMESNLNIYQE